MLIILLFVLHTFSTAEDKCNSQFGKFLWGKMGVQPVKIEFIMLIFGSSNKKKTQLLFTNNWIDKISTFSIGHRSPWNKLKTYLM